MLSVKKLKPYLMPAVLGLLVINVGLSIRMFMTSRHCHRYDHGRSFKFVVRQIDPNEDQERQFKDLFLTHRQKTSRLEQNLRAREYDMKLAQINEQDDRVETLSDTILQFRGKILAEKSGFMASILSICNEEQKQKLKKLFGKMRDRHREVEDGQGHGRRGLR